MRIITNKINKLDIKFGSNEKKFTVKKNWAVLNGIQAKDGASVCLVHFLRLNLIPGLLFFWSFGMKMEINQCLD